MEFNEKDLNPSPESIDITKKLLANWDKVAAINANQSVFGSCAVCDYLYRDLDIEDPCRHCPIGQKYSGCNAKYSAGEI